MNDTVIINENPGDGSTTVIEITHDSDKATDLEDVIEALSDENPADDDADEVNVEVYTIPAEAEETDWTTDGFTAEGGDVILTDETMPETEPAAEDFSVVDAGVAEVPVETIAETTEPVEEPTEIDTAAIEAEAHAEAAAEAQASADEFIASGDYGAAAEAREVAENEAWEAGSSDMLHGSGSIGLESAAADQENAEYFEQQEAMHAQQGDYEAAREDAENAAYATEYADWRAGGADHSGQAEAEANQMDWAVWEEGNAEYNANAAEEYAAQGDFEIAEEYAAEAAEHQENADYYGDLGEHGGDIGVYDESSEVESGGSYEAADYSSSYDSSSIDSSTVDTSSTDYSSE